MWGFSLESATLTIPSKAHLALFSVGGFLLDSATVKPEFYSAMYQVPETQNLGDALKK